MRLIFDFVNFFSSKTEHSQKVEMAIKYLYQLT